MLTNHHPAAQTGPRPRPPMMDHILLSSLALRRKGKTCRAYRMMPYTQSKYTHQSGIDVCAESSEPLSFVFTHFLCQITEALVMLGLCDCAMFQKAIKQGFLLQEQLMVFLRVGERFPLFVFYFNFHVFTSFLSGTLRSAHYSCKRTYPH